MKDPILINTYVVRYLKLYDEHIYKNTRNIVYTIPKSIYVPVAYTSYFRFVLWILSMSY